MHRGQARTGVALLALLILLACSGPATVSVAELPAEARQVLLRIESGGNFGHPKDGAAFHNREKRLPARSSGFYREFTVKTPGQPGRGPRRIVYGSPSECYYTEDHYRTFRRIIRGPPEDGKVP